MKNSKMRLFLLLLGALIVIAAIVAVVKRDQIADLILRGGDLALAGKAAQNSPQAALAIDFLGALRAKDHEAIARLATAEQVARFAEDAKESSADSQGTVHMMLEDLPTDPAALRSTIKSVQGHEDRAEGGWKVSGY